MNFGSIVVEASAGCAGFSFADAERRSKSAAHPYGTWEDSPTSRAQRGGPFNLVAAVGLEPTTYGL